MQDSKQDFALALVLFGIGLGALLYIQFGPGQALQSSQDAQITFRSFPSAIAIMLMGLSALFALSSGLAVRRLRTQDRPAPAPSAPAVALPRYLRLRILALLGLLIAFALAIGTLPLFVLASVFLFVAFIIFGQVSLPRITVVALIGGALFHGLFVFILHLPLG